MPTIFIGLSVPLVHASPAIMSALERVKAGFGRDVRDRWSVPAFAAQRTMLLERLFGWQSERRRRQVIVLSGDVHVGAAFNVRALRRPVMSRITRIVPPSAGVSSPSTATRRPLRGQDR